SIQILFDVGPPRTKIFCLSLHDALPISVDIAMKFVRHELKILRQLFTENVGYTPALYNCDIRTVTMHLEEKRVFFRQVEAEAALIAKLRGADNLATNNRWEQIDAIATGPLESGRKREAA